MLDLIRRAEAESTPLSKLAATLAARHGEEHTPILPVYPPEVWACGCTYEPSAAFRDAEHGTRSGMYAHVYEGARPEIFFKGTCRVCAADGQTIGIRSDSKFTAPEPELALVLGRNGTIVAFTIGNDVSAWDLERENALYLPQSKFYNGCCGLGPTMVTADAIADPYDLELTCTIVRDGQTVFSGAVNTSKLHRRFDVMLDYLTRANNVPAGSVLLTGTGIIVPETSALQPEDVVMVSVPEIGSLSNRAVLVG